jgi:HEAT repeat protein
MMITDVEAGLPFRGRAARTLAQIGSPAALVELERRLPESPGSLADLIAVLLANAGRPAGLDRVVELSQSKTTSRSVEALRALGGLKDAPPDARELALIELLSALSPDVHLEENRAAIDGLARLGDPRALTPLRRFLVAGPDALAHETARAMRALAGKEAALLGPDPRRWDAFFQANPPPAPPAFTPRRHDSEDDLDLPTP